MKNMKNSLIELWVKGHAAGASFPVGLTQQTPRQAAEICGMREIKEITPEGDVVAHNKWGNEIVIMSVGGRGPIAVDATFQRVVDFSEKIGKKPGRYQPTTRKQTSRPPSDSGDGSDRARDDKSLDPARR
jgi:hypothetical protein